MSETQSLAGKIAVVTGAGRGIGKSTAIAFANAGADVAICARSQSDLDATKAAIEGIGRTCFMMQTDLGDANETKAFCDATIQRFGHVDVIVNNAGAYFERGAFEASDPDMWWRTMEVNVRGPYLITRGRQNHQSDIWKRLCGLRKQHRLSRL